MPTVRDIQRYLMLLALNLIAWHLTTVQGTFSTPLKDQTHCRRSSPESELCRLMVFIEK
ncbi:hypothetical protein DPMN_139922 [Dreissena polymorpha]|uniref:Uncharacterized protein n=1 Tax=Dreissena polymorpha TaxID=45954 RepID=A0A9D4G768_DREPO|nr:hypothetical protein DPMN_139922 [Dreissena polymorpha]